MIYYLESDCIGRTPLVRLSRCSPGRDVEVLATLEMFNPYGSTKDRPTRFIVEQGMAEGSLAPGMRLVESTSGNLGVGLAAVARLHDLAFTAIVDPNYRDQPGPAAGLRHDRGDGPRPRRQRRPVLPTALSRHGRAHQVGGPRGTLGIVVPHPDRAARGGDR